jgi:hypothetical protein
MKQVTSKTTNPHAWFFAYLKTVEGWGTGYDDVIKEAIIYNYSGKKTESLKELYQKYPERYRQMRSELSAKKETDNKQYNLERKRLIAVIFSHLEKNGYKPNMEYVKKVACKAAKADNFNNIPLSTLKSLYRRFGEKNMQIQLNELINSISSN